MLPCDGVYVVVCTRSCTWAKFPYCCLVGGLVCVYESLLLLWRCTEFSTRPRRPYGTVSRPKHVSNYRRESGAIFAHRRVQKDAAQRDFNWKRDTDTPRSKNHRGANELKNENLFVTYVFRINYQMQTYPCRNCLAGLQSGCKHTYFGRYFERDLSIGFVDVQSYL